jgi:hypothetical protein
VNPRWACITANVTSSASLSLGAIPTGGRHGAQARFILQDVIYADIECGGEGAQVGVHETSTVELGDNADRGRLRRVSGGFPLEPLVSGLSHHCPPVFVLTDVRGVLVRSGRTRPTRADRDMGSQPRKLDSEIAIDAI